MSETKVTEEQLRDIQGAITKLREDHEGKVALTGEEKDRINAALDNYEEVNQKMVAEREADRQAAIEMKEQVVAMEEKVVEMSLFKQKAVDADPKAYKQTPEYKSLNTYMQEGERALFDMEVKDSMRTDKGEQGGFLVPEIMANVILKQIEEISPVRQFARKWGPMNAKTLTIPVRKTIPAAPYFKELEASTDSNSTYRTETLTAFRQQATVPITQDLLSFSNFDMESEIMGDVNLSFAKTEGEKFVLGTGDKEPEGLTVNPDVETVDTESSAVLSLDDVIKVCGLAKVGYNYKFYFNKQTLVNLRVEKDSNGNYLWRQGGETLPTQINGFDYVLLQDMVDQSAGTGAKVVAFADLFAGYSILDSIQMSVIRDDVTEKRKGLVEFAVNRWNTGQVAIPEAIKIITIKA